MILGIDASRCKNGTGIEVYSTAIVQSLLRELAQSTHPPFNDVVLYTPKHLSQETIGGQYSFVGERVITIPKLWTQIGLSLEMIQEEPDVLFIPGHVLPLVHAEKSVVTIHDTAFMHFPESYSFFQRMYLKFTTWLAVREAKMIIVPSKATKYDLIKSFNCPEKKIAVVAHGYEMKTEKKNNNKIDDDELLRTFGLDTKSKYIFYIGRLEKKKNLVRLVEAFRRFHEKFPEWKLILAGGRGYGFEELLGVVGSCDLWDSVLMPGYVTDEERDTLYRHCQFVAFISLAEGFGLPILEAVSRGKPVLASDIDVLREIGENELTYVDPLDDEAIYRGMCEMEKGKFSREKLVALSQKYSWEKAAKETLHVLKSVI